MKKYKILLVDDDPVLIKGTTLYLEQKGYHVFTANNGKAAIELLQTSSIDLVLTDLVMPGIDGFQVLKEVKKLHPEIMVLAMTGFNDVNFVIDCLRLGADDYIFKICKPEEMLFRVKNCFKKLEIKKRAEKTEERLHKSDTKYRDLIENIEEVVYAIDKSGQITYISPVIESLSGYKPQELIGRSFIEFVYHEDLSYLRKQFKKILSGHLKSNEYRLMAKSGKIHWVRVSSRPIYKGDRVIGLNGVMMDITDQKRLQEEILNAQRLESLGILSSGIAHDFNNLLHVIMGNISLANEILNIEGKTSENLREAEKACIRAKELTTRLISFSKGGDPVKELTNIGDVIKDAIISEFKGGAVEWEISISDDIKPVYIDVTQIKQVVHNIAVNAVEAMQNKGRLKIYCGNVDITNQSHLALSQGSYIKISFEDQGCGISKENLKKIFDPYFSTKDMGVNKGQGLGLAICYSIISRHKGLITVESVPEKGSAFSIYLPAAVSIKEPDFRKSGGSSATQKPVKHPVAVTGKILVMDDEEMIRSFMSQILNRLGYDVETCTGGKEAVEIYKKAMKSNKPFDVVILNLTNQYGMGGQESMRRLLEMDHDAKGIVFTGYSNDPIVTNFRLYGFSGFLIKPATKDQLSQVINTVISRGPKKGK